MQEVVPEGQDVGCAQQTEEEAKVLKQKVEHHRRNMAVVESTRTAARVGEGAGRPTMDAQQDQELEARTLGVSLDPTPQEVCAVVTATGSRECVNIVINAITDGADGSESSGESMLGSWRNALSTLI